MLYLSLVLATYGRSDLIGRFIEYLSVQTCKNFELIVVDQNSDDRVLPYIEQARCAGIAVSHYLMEKPNLSAARNLGIAHATGDVIAFPDDDCWYEPDVIEQVLTTFSTRQHWSGLVADWAPTNAENLKSFFSFISLRTHSLISFSKDLGDLTNRE